jgi:N-acyl-D-amino-acid deacylase
MDCRIENGTIIDGSGKQAFKADVEIRNAQITAILPPAARGPQHGGRHGTKSVSEAAHMRRIDATGCYVSPGFIDAHSHADLGPFMTDKLELKLRQGVTTEVVGQCGFSPAPVPAGRQAEWMRYYVPGSPITEWQWESTAEFYTALRNRGLPLNFMPFVGHGTLRFAVKADSSAPMEASELDRMEALLEQAFDEGAAGLSFGLIYVPELFADRAELRRAAEAAARHRRLLSVHMRSESDELIEALEEMAELQSATGVRLHISHLKAIGIRNQHKIDQALELIEAHSLSFDSYPYTYGSTSLLSLLPPQLFAGTSVQKGLARLSENHIQKEIISLLNGESPAPGGMPWDNLALLVGWDMIELVFIPDGPDACLTGRSLASAAERRGTSPAELTLQLCRSYGGQIRIIDVFSEEATVRKILSHPSGIISSDTLLGGHQHPRVAGSFPRVLSNYTYEQASGPLNLEEAVHRMSGRSAQFLGLIDRGIVGPGMYADIAVWRPDFFDTSSRETPEEPARGLQYLLINGELVIDAAEPDKSPEKSSDPAQPRVCTDTAGRVLTAPDYVRPQPADQ